MINPPRLDLHSSHLAQCRQPPSQNFLAYEVPAAAEECLLLTQSGH